MSANFNDINGLGGCVGAFWVLAGVLLDAESKSGLMQHRGRRAPVIGIVSDRRVFKLGQMPWTFKREPWQAGVVTRLDH